MSSFIFLAICRLQNIHIMQNPATRLNSMNDLTGWLDTQNISLDSEYRVLKMLTSHIWVRNDRAVWVVSQPTRKLWAQLIRALVAPGMMRSSKCQAALLSTVAWPSTTLIIGGQYYCTCIVDSWTLISLFPEWLLLLISWQGGSQARPDYCGGDYWLLTYF